MNMAGVINSREDIEQYIFNQRKVSKEEIYRKFLSDSDFNSVSRLECEINCMVDKSRKAFERGQEYYIDFDGEYYIIKGK